MFNVVARVASQQGHCEAGHRVGDEFVIGQTTPCGLCSWAFCALFPFSQVLEFGASFPWEPEPGMSRVACPDPDNPVVFELRRVELRGMT
ncbi:MAG: TIGR04076 family protein [Chloroflexota bacterium]